MSGGALAFMMVAWVCVLSLVGWSWYRLLRTDTPEERLPPPGTSL